MKHLDLFSGIGGFALAARNVGWETTQFVEIDPFCCRILRKHWPDVPIHDDIQTFDGRSFQGTIDILTGGFPCQDISVAGKQAGIDGERSGLWSELARVLGEVRPRFAVLENVPNLLSGDYGRWFQRVLGDLASIGFDAEWHCIPASAIGAPHQRDRVWIIAYPRSFESRGVSSIQRQAILEAGGCSQDVADSSRTRREGLGNGPERGIATYAESRSSGWWSTEPNVGRVAHGVPKRVDRLKGLGNAIVPACAELIFRCIREADENLHEM